jgi:hypothetical protein
MADSLILKSLNILRVEFNGLLKAFDGVLVLPHCLGHEAVIVPGRVICRLDTGELLTILECNLTYAPRRLAV